MKLNGKILLLGAVLGLSTLANTSCTTTEGAIIGGAVGAAVGASADDYRPGRGAVVGGILGAAVGGAVASDNAYHSHRSRGYYRRHSHGYGHQPAPQYYGGYGYQRPRYYGGY